MTEYEKMLRKKRSYNARLKVMYLFSDGVYGQWERNCKRITDLFHRKVIGYGALVAHGILNDTFANHFRELVKKNRVTRTQYETTIGCLESEVRSQDKFLATVNDGAK